MPKDGWYDGPLESLVTLQRGFDITKKEQEPGPYEVISSSGPNSTHSDFKVAGPGVVIGRKGTLGTVFYSEHAYWPHDTTLWVKDFHGNHPKFCYYFLKTMGFERFDCGASNPTLNRNHIHQLPIQYPPITGQRRIAAILSAYDDLIENNTRRIKILEEMARMLYREWFVNFRFPDHQKVKMVESELGPIPEGWTNASLNTLMDFQGGAQPPKSEWVTEARDGFIRMIQIRDYETDAHVGFVREGRNLQTCCDSDIMIARYGASVGRICWGLAGAYNVALVRVSPQEDHFKEFLRSYLSSDTFQRLLIGMSGRTAQAGFNKSVLGAIVLPIPTDSKLFKQYECTAHPMTAMILSLSRAIKNLRTTRDLLLPKLIAGEIPLEVAAEAMEQTA